MEISSELAKRSLEIGAIKLNTKEPFTWESGYRMPIYTNNSIHLWYPENRKLIVDGFQEIIYWCHMLDSYEDFIAGTAKTGIFSGVLLAEERNKPFIYVGEKSKDHDLKNKIEKPKINKDLLGKRGILIEDLISTGESSVNAVQSILDNNGTCDFCFSIFSYGFKEAKKMFEGKLPYDQQNNFLKTPCSQFSILTYEQLLFYAQKLGYIKYSELKTLEEWGGDPFNWGEKTGFLKVKK